jgi:hypothetical protein
VSTAPADATPAVRVHLPPQAKADAKSGGVPQALHGHYTFRFASPVADPDATSVQAAGSVWHSRFVVLPEARAGRIDVARSIEKMEAMQRRASLAAMDAESWATLGRLCHDVYQAMDLDSRQGVLSARMARPRWYAGPQQVAGITSAPVRARVEEWSAALRLMPEAFLKAQVKKLDNPPVMTRLRSSEFDKHRLLWQAQFAAVYEAASLDLQQQLEDDAINGLLKLRKPGRIDQQVMRIVFGDRIGTISTLRFATLPLAGDITTSSDEDTPEPQGPEPAAVAAPQGPALAATSAPPDPSPAAPR